MSRRVIFRGRNGRIEGPFRAKEVDVLEEFAGEILDLGPFTQVDLNNVLYRVKDLTLEVTGSISIEYLDPAMSSFTTTTTVSVNINEVAIRSAFFINGYGIEIEDEVDMLGHQELNFSVGNYDVGEFDVKARHESGVDGRPQVNWQFASGTYLNDDGEEQVFPRFSFGRDDVSISGFMPSYLRPVQKIINKNEYYLSVGGSFEVNLESAELGVGHLQGRFSPVSSGSFNTTGDGEFIVGEYIEKELPFSLAYFNDDGALSTELISQNLTVKITATKWFAYANEDGQPIWNTETGERTSNPFS